MKREADDTALLRPFAWFVNQFAKETRKRLRVLELAARSEDPARKSRIEQALSAYGSNMERLNVIVGTNDSRLEEVEQRLKTFREPARLDESLRQSINDEILTARRSEAALHLRLQALANQVAAIRGFIDEAPATRRTKKVKR